MTTGPLRGTILLVEDDDRARMSLGTLLESSGQRVTAASSAEEALELLDQREFDVVLTDIRMHQGGLTVLEATRRLSPRPMVILLTGYGSVETAVAALRGGAYDYLLKPCDPQDVLARVAGALRRRAVEVQQAEAVRIIAQGLAQLGVPLGGAAAAGAEPGEQVFAIGDLRIGQARHLVAIGSQTVHVTPIEYALLRCLAEQPGRVLGYREIVRRTHGYEVSDSEAQVLLKGHIRNLRGKIGPDYVVNVRGFGYKIVPSGEA